MKTVEILQPVDVYHPGDITGMEDEAADKLVAEGVVKLHKPAKKTKSKE